MIRFEVENLWKFVNDVIDMINILIFLIYKIIKLQT